MDEIGRELRQAARRLARSPTFTLASVLTLALAIGANASIFAVVQRVLLNPLPYGDSGRLIALDYGIPVRNIPSGFNSMSWQLYHHLADHARTLDGVAVYSTGAVTLTGDGNPERIQVSRATPSLAPVLRVAPALGRWFTEAGRRAGRRTGRGAVARAVGAPVRRRRRYPGPIGDARRRADRGRRRHAGRRLRFRSDSPIDVWMAAQSSRASASFLYNSPAWRGCATASPSRTRAPR